MSLEESPRKCLSKGAASQRAPAPCNGMSAPAAGYAAHVPSITGLALLVVRPRRCGMRRP